MPDAASILRPSLAQQHGRRLALERDRRWAAIVLDVIAGACPFPALVYWEPEVERMSVRIGGLVYARLTWEEARRAPTEDAAAVLLGLRARDAYLDLPPLEHDHQLGTE